MSVPQGELLRMLSGGVVPAARPVQAPDRVDPAADFGAMLRKAQRGELRSDLPVTVPRGLSPALDQPERARVAEATDLAQREGISVALVDLGDRSLRVDVRERAVIDAPDAQLRAVADVDGYVRAPAAGDKALSETVSAAAAGPARVVRNPSLIDALADATPGDA
ncbi:MAG: hypothetical protein AAGA55_09070 [Planctomycetota bacterium]